VHRNRLIALAGVIIGIIGLFMKSLDTDGEELLPALNASNPDFPDGVPTIWGGLDLWAQWAVVILIIAVVVICLRPVISEALDRNSSMIVAVIGVALLAYAVVKWMDAGDKADTLQAAFAQAAGAGAIPGAFEVSRSVGFLILIIGTVLVTFAGAMGFMSSDDE
jgi:hypothetical protein